MDVMEKLVGLLENHCSVIGEDNCKASQNEKCTPRDCAICLASNLIANGVTVQAWKPISEPPKEKGTYLVCTDNGGVLLGHWYGTAWNAGGGAKKHLAYWMEKPQPPKGE